MRNIIKWFVEWISYTGWVWVLYITIMIGSALLVYYLHSAGCDHAKAFSKHEVRSDGFGCYVKGDDGHWKKIPDPFNYLE